jgi:[protein-PII] uridylyltransferase
LAAVAPKPTLTSAAQLKLRLVEGRATTRAEFQRSGSGRSATRAHCALVDEVVCSAWETLQVTGSALLAVGGYGRGELYPYSDVDVLILLPQALDAQQSASIEAFVALLWDVGLEIAHSVRTIEECLRESSADVTVETSLLEARRLTGNGKLARALARSLKEQRKPAAFWDAKLAEQRKRHMRFHETAYNLEPNIKESPGGLRDLQTVLWLARVTSVGHSWKALAERGIIERTEAARIERDERMLRELRVRLHYLAGRREDRLLFDFQMLLARELGIEDSAKRRASEILMQRYYRTVKEISLYCNVLLQNLAEIAHPERDMTTRRLNARFQRRGDLLEMTHKDVFEREPATILEAFLMLQRQPDLSGMSAQTQRALWRARERIGSGFRANPLTRAALLQILREPRRVTFVLRLMNQYGVLARLIPAFGRIVGQMQHDGYHVYTVDEHILKVLRNVRRFAVPSFDHEFPLCSNLIGDFPRAEVLYLGALFHDIAKGRGGDHSALGSVDALRFARQLGLARQDCELVSWLVAKHLVMSVTAQKQDLSDPNVIAAFAREMQSERRLIALYLLTVADIRGTSPKVWNAWKAKLLEDLFRATRRSLSGQADPEAELHAKKNEARRLLGEQGFTEGLAEAIWADFDESYFQRHDAQEIAWHTRALRRRARSLSPVVSAQAPLVQARVSSVGEGIQVMIYCPDQEGLFARICGFFSRAGYDIADAKIYTTQRGFALDTLQVLDQGGDAAHYRDFLAYIEHELSQRLRERAELGTPVAARVSRRQRHFPIEPKVEILSVEHADQHTISFVAGDRVGLLYSVSLVLLRHNLSVQSAKINTLGERAEDTFFVRGKLGTETQSTLEQDLLATLRGN